MPFPSVLAHPCRCGERRGPPWLGVLPGRGMGGFHKVRDFRSTPALWGVLASASPRGPGRELSFPVTSSGVGCWPCGGGGAPSASVLRFRGQDVRRHGGARLRFPASWCRFFWNSVPRTCGSRGQPFGPSLQKSSGLPFAGASSCVSADRSPGRTSRDVGFCVFKGFSFLVRAPHPEERPPVRSARPARSLGRLLGAGARAGPGWAAAGCPLPACFSSRRLLPSLGSVQGQWLARGRTGGAPSFLGPAWGRAFAGPAAAPAGWLQEEFSSEDTRARLWPWVCGGSWPSLCCVLSLSRGRPAAPALRPRLADTRVPGLGGLPSRVLWL